MPRSVNPRQSTRATSRRSSTPQPGPSRQPRRSVSSRHSSSAPESPSRRSVIPPKKPAQKKMNAQKTTHAYINKQAYYKGHLGCTKKMAKEWKELTKNFTKFCIPKLPFARVVKEVTQEHGEFQFQSLALLALQEASETYMIQFMEAAFQLAQHAKRQTLRCNDMGLLRWIQKEN